MEKKKSLKSHTRINAKGACVAHIKKHSVFSYKKHVKTLFAFTALLSIMIFSLKLCKIGQYDGAQKNQRADSID